MAYPSFTEKLRLGNLYPSAPVKRPGRESYPLYNKFLEQQQAGGIQHLGPPDQFTQHPGGGITKPMDVVMGPSISETARATAAANVIHGDNLMAGKITPYQQGQLANKQAELAMRQQQYGNVNDINQQKVDIAGFKAKNPNSKFIQGKDGKLRAIDPLTNEVTDLGQTGMTEQAIAALNQENAIQRIDRTGEMRREQEILAQGGRESLEGLRQRGRVDLQNDAQSGRLDLQNDAQQGRVDLRRSTPILPSQERVAKLNRAQEAKNTRPEWSKYIKTIPGGGYTVTAPSSFAGFATGPSREVYDAINAFIEAPPDPIRSMNFSDVPKTDPKTDPNKPKSKYQVTVK